MSIDINEIPINYQATEVEKEIYDMWEKNECFKADVNSTKPHYSMVIPPPNVTGVLHMGHALDGTLQDILVRYHRMAGYETLWIPGTDHAGIAILRPYHRSDHLLLVRTERCTHSGLFPCGPLVQHQAYAPPDRQDTHLLHHRCV